MSNNVGNWGALERTEALLEVQVGRAAYGGPQRPNSREEYADFWTDLICRRMADMNVEEFAESGDQIRLFLRDFFGAHPFHPRGITPQQITEFLGSHLRGRSTEEARMFCQVLEFVYHHGLRDDGSFDAKMAAIRQAAKTEPGTEARAARADLLSLLRDAANSKGYTQRTVDNYTGSVRRYLRECDGDPLHGETANRYLLKLAEEGKAAGTINNVGAALRFLLKKATGKADVAKMVIQRKEPKKLPSIYAEEEIGQLINALTNTKHRLLLMAAYSCALRVGELVGLRVKDIDYARNVVWIRAGKGKKDRRVPLSRRLRTALEAELGKRQEGFVFVGSGGKGHLSKRSAELVFHKACEKAGLEHRGAVHSLRHSLATHLLEHGTDLRVIQEFLGHARSTTTEIYTHVSNTTIQRIQNPLDNLPKPV